MKPIVAEKSLVAYCGLYCGSCKKYLQEKCPGCPENAKATWCKVRACCLEHEYSSCADCTIEKDLQDCRKFNNLIAKVFALLFNSNRAACIEQIKNLGLTEHAEIMAALQKQTLPRKLGGD